MTSRVEKAHRNGERRKWNWGERAFVTAPEGRVVAGIVLVSGCHIGEGLQGSASSVALSYETSSWKAGAYLDRASKLAAPPYPSDKSRAFIEFANWVVKTKIINSFLN